MDRQWQRLKYFVGLILLCISGPCWALITLHDHSPPLNIGKQIDTLEDPAGNLTLEDVIASDRFQPSQASRPSFGFTESVYWVRFRLASLSNVPDWYLQVRYPLLDFVDFYSPEPEAAQGYRRFTAGDLRRPENGKRTRTYAQFPLINDAKVRTYYLRVDTQSSMILDLRILNGRQLAEQTNHEQYFQGAYFGLMSVMALYNFFVFLVIRDRSYLYYTGFIASTAVFQIALHGYAHVHFWPQSLWWNNISNLFAACLSVAFCGKFAQSFIQLRQFEPALDRALTWLSSLAFIITGLSLVIDYQLAVLLIAITGLAVVPLSIVAAAIAWRKGSRPAGFFLIAWLVLLIFALLHILCILGILPSYPALENSVQIGGAVEAVLLSMGLADRINRSQHAALKAANRANQAQDEFMSTLSGELMSPITRIRSSLDTLDRRPGTTGANTLKTAADASAYLQSLIQSMSHFVALRRGTARIEPGHVDLKDILTQLHDYFHSVNDNASLQVSFAWDADIPDFIPGDAPKLTSVILELMKNAFAFTQQGYISIAAEVLPDSRICVSVTDSGAGISREKLKRIVEGFRAGKRALAQDNPGPGLGLTMANDILMLMGSRLEIQSEPDQGTRVWFHLPRTTD
ncbi:MAG: sensor histidine kinase [Pseudomonadota bacterium]|nr:sensor histidine kinase [Pseudomonadota bacterium]